MHFTIFIIKNIKNSLGTENVIAHALRQQNYYKIINNKVVCWTQQIIKVAPSILRDLKTCSLATGRMFAVVKLFWVIK